MEPLCEGGREGGREGGKEEKRNRAWLCKFKKKTRPAPVLSGREGGREGR
jgi:hypothetical protein